MANGTAACLKWVSLNEAMSEVKLSHLDNMGKIAELETEVCTLSGEFDSIAVKLVCESRTTDLEPSESLAKSDQSDHATIKRNWDWIQTVLRCAEVHRQNAAVYHQFFCDVNQTCYWMKSALPAGDVTIQSNKLPDTEEFFDDVELKLQALSAKYIQWSNEVYRLFERSWHIVPVPARVHTLTEPRPVVALADYKTDEIEFLKGDNLLLTDNSDKHKWRVTNIFGLTTHVESVLMLIPAVSEDAVEAAVKLLIDFCSLWTRTVKDVRHQLIQLILTLFSDWSDEEFDQLHYMKAKDKNILLHNLQSIESIFLEILGDSDSLHKLQDHIFQLRTIIEESHDDDTTDSVFLKTIAMQFQRMLDITVIFQMFWTRWFAFTERLQRFRDPSLFMNEIVYTYFSSQRFKRFLDTHLKSKQTLALSPLSLPSTENVSPEEIISPGSHVVITTEHTDIEKEELQTSTHEEYFRYMLNAAIDPRDNTKISIETAKERGILDADLSCYTNPVTKEVLSIAEALQKDLLVGKLVVHRKEKKSEKSYGIIVVKSFEETSKYSIQFVVDPVSGEKVDEAEAKRRKIIDECGVMYTLKDGSSISVSSAISKGLVIQEDNEDIVQGRSKVISTTYIVTGVVDQKMRTKVSIEEGLKLGILDRKTNEYVHNVTGKRYGVQEAIKRGFIKGRLCKDPSKLDYDPENSLVINKFKRAKANLMRSLHVINAFKTLKH
ncbi:dystonin-like [Gigantopelta aegis]|uniref:dystonin-like n=1 Tax=Gigantopelta aegis TaxID=1735272 RepID=UPI001B88B273|nr:dystonin-like [Gigantopelta aegis]